MATTPRLYVGYIRVSTEEQKKKGFSPQVQRAKIEEYVENHCNNDEYELVFYRDLGYTGKYGIRQYPQLFDKNRPGLSDAVDRVMAEVQERPVHLVCLDGYRLERKPLVAEVLWEKIFIPCGIAVHSVDEGGQLDGSPGAQLARRVTSAAGATVPAYASRRVKQSHEFRANQGYLHCVPPYGWERLPKKDGQRWHDIAPVPEQVEVLKKMKDKALAGWGTWRIARWLDEQGIDSPGKGHKWYPRTVADLLRNPVHAGYLRHHDEVIKGQHFDKRIWDLDTTHELDRVITQRHRSPKRGVKLGDFLLAGMLTCGYCGSALSSTYDSKSGQRFYKCTAMTQSPDHYHVSISKIASDLEIAVEEDLRRVLDETEIHRMTQQQVEQISETKTRDLATQHCYLQGRLQDLGEDLTAAISRNRRGELSDVAFEPVQKHLEAQIEQIHRRANEIDTRLNAIRANTIRLEQAREAARSFDTMWNTMDTEERRGLLQSLIEEIVVTRQERDVRLQIKYHFLPEAIRVVPHGMATPGDSDLTRRELEAMLLHSEGYTHAEIAKQFNVSPAAPRQYFFTARRKLGVATDDEAVKAAWDTIQEMKPYLKLYGRRRSKPEMGSLLSSDERELLECFTEGLNYDEACAALGISKSAAYSRAASFRKKIGVDTNDEAVQAAVEQELL